MSVKTHTTAGDYGSSSPWALAAHGPTSELYAFGAGPLASRKPQVASEVFLKAGWKEASGVWYCGKEATFTGQPGLDGPPVQYAFSLPSLQKLGTCPGATVVGSLRGCYNQATPADSSCDGSGKVLRGTIDSRPYELTSDHLGGAGMGAHATGGGALVFRGW